MYIILNHIEISLLLIFVQSNVNNVISNCILRKIINFED